MTGWSTRRLRTSGITFAILAIILVAVTLASSLWLNRGQVRVANEFVLVCGLVVAMQVFVGNTGILSFGHASLFCVGAYVAGLATISVADKTKTLPNLPDWLGSADLGLVGGVVVAIAAVALFAGATGYPISRMRHDVIPMATLALLVVTYTVTNLWDDVTRGTRGLVGVPNLVTPWTILATSLVIIAAALLFKASPTGLRVQAVREDPVAAEAHGIDVARTRFVAWMASAVLMGLGAGVWALNAMAFGPDQFFFEETFSLLAMLILGGMGSVSGAVAGAAIISLIGELLRGLERGFDLGGLHVGELPGLVQFITALAILLVLIFRPRGLFGSRELGMPRFAMRAGGRHD